MEQSRRIVVVIGAHRSGTSLATSILGELGVDLGANLMLPVADNPKGFWEDLDVLALNDRALSALGARWDALGVSATARANGAALMPFVAEAVDLLRDKLRGKSAWGFKNPRTAYLRPLWQPAFQALGLDDRYLVPIRAPHAVMESLRRRNGFSPTHGYLCWFEHVIAALAWAAERPHAVVDYDRMLAAPHTEIRRIAGALGLSADPADTARAASLVEPALCHASRFSGIDPEMPSFVGRAYDLSLRLAADESCLREESARAELALLERVVDDNVAVHRRMFALEHSARSEAATESVRADLQRQRDEMRALVVSLRETTNAMRDHALAEAVGVNRRLNRELSQRDERIERLERGARDAERLTEELSWRSSVVAKWEQTMSAQSLNAEESATAASIRASGLFDDAYYLQQAPDVLATGGSPLVHYIRYGSGEGRWPNRYFDGAYYRATYLDVASAGMNPLVHYIEHGAAEGRKTSAAFDSAAYLELNQDVAIAGINPLFHYLRFGQFEGRPVSQELPDLELVAEESVDDLCDRLPRIFRAEPVRTPTVSVIIPVHDHFEFTIRCLLSLARLNEKASFEIIVVDDASSDRTQSVLGACRGLRYVRNHSNQGFVRACNRGADLARGVFLWFLNNDTVVLPDCIDALVDAFAERPAAGLAGSKLVYPNGRLQEAGGIIWNDGSGCNYGRNDHPGRPEYNYPRRVDYCSGASIMLPTSLFRELAGFSEAYSPAYYEDTDLAFRVRERGREVWYQPRSVVVHHEGVSSGTDTSHGTKAYQVVNARKFRERWQRTLERHFAPGSAPARARDQQALRRALFLDATTPTPDHDAGSAEAVTLLRMLNQLGYQVTFAPQDLHHVPDYVRPLEEAGIYCLFRPHSRSLEAHLELHGNDYDLVVASRAPVAGEAWPLLRKYCQRAKVVFYTVDLHHLRLHRQAELCGDRDLHLSAESMRVRELMLAAQADATIVVSEFERELLQREAPRARVYCMPLVRESEIALRSRSGREDVLFVGGFGHPPNVDAVQWLVREAWAEVRAALPKTRLLIAGSQMPDEIHALASPGVVPLGFVDNLDALLDRCVLTVAPLRFGAGSKGKVVTSMARGVPVVCTSIAAEGMGTEAGRHFLPADSPREFAEAIVRLHDDELLWTSLSRNGQDFVRSHNGYDVALVRFAAVLRDLGLDGPPDAGAGR